MTSTVRFGMWLRVGHLPGIGWLLCCLTRVRAGGRRGIDTINLAYDADSPWTRRYEITYDLAAAYEPMTRRPVVIESSASAISEMSLAT